MVSVALRRLKCVRVITSPQPPRLCGRGPDRLLRRSSLHAVAGWSAGPPRPPRNSLAWFDRLG
eukprot:4456725-Pyramimonas_sp.AAC.1